jgi:hypothetical protein
MGRKLFWHSSYEEPHWIELEDEDDSEEHCGTCERRAGGFTSVIQHMLNIRRYNSYIHLAGREKHRSTISQSLQQVLSEGHVSKTMGNESGSGAVVLRLVRDRRHVLVYIIPSSCTVKSSIRFHAHPRDYRVNLFWSQYSCYRVRKAVSNLAEFASRHRSPQAFPRPRSFVRSSQSPIPVLVDYDRVRKGGPK